MTSQLNRASEPRKEACRCAALFIGNGTEWIDSIPGFMVRPSLLYTVIHGSDQRRTHVRKDPASTDDVRMFGVWYLVPNNPMFLLLFIPSRNSENAEMTCVQARHPSITTSGHTAHYTLPRVMTCDRLYVVLNIIPLVAVCHQQVRSNQQQKKTSSQQLAASSSSIRITNKCRAPLC